MPIPPAEPAVPASPFGAGLPAGTLPQDPDGVLKLAAQSLFDTLTNAAMGVLVVDRSHRIVWISEGYKQFLPQLGHAEDNFVGRPVREVIPNTMMDQVIDSGQAILVDLLSNHAGTFLVSRMPLRNPQGEVLGALGLVLLDHPETTMQPLIAKFGRLQRELDSTREQLAAHLSAQRRPKYTVASFIGNSPAAIAVKRQARRVAQTDSTVLLLGETGTGKELLAHAIHAASARAARPFIGVNIAAVPDTLLEAEFFGVAPGAYTGADRKGRDGKFKLADGGTLFLDEIGDMPAALQAKLLRVLQEQEVEPLGSNQVLRVDVRIIAATSRDLAAMVAAGSFRADLFYRLNVLPIRLPPLRDRREDIEALVDVLTDDIARRSSLPHKTLAPDALALLARQPWPGNIRELRNVLEQASLMTDDLVLTARHFGEGTGGLAAQEGETTAAANAPGGMQPVVEAAAPVPLNVPMTVPVTVPEPTQAVARNGMNNTLPSAATPGPTLVPLPQAIAALEQQAIREALRLTGGNKVAAARLLGISRASLYDKLPPAAGPG